MNNINTKREILSVFSQTVEHKTLCICSVTGIPFSISSPPSTIGRFAFQSIKHPLSNIGSARKFAELPSSKIKENPPVIIAGVLLTLMQEFKLRNDKLSAVEANLSLLTSNKPETLQALLAFLAPLSVFLASKCPRISLEQDVSLETYIWACKSALSEKIEGKQEKRITSNSKQGKLVTMRSISPEIRKEAKRLVEEIKESITNKLYTILRFSINGNNLATMSPSLRSTIISELGKVVTDSNTAHARNDKSISILISLIKDAGKDASMQEKILSTHLDEYAPISTTVDTGFGIPTKKMSLAEILASKKAGKQGNAEGIGAAYLPALSSLPTVAESLSIIANSYKNAVGISPAPQKTEEIETKTIESEIAKEWKAKQVNLKTELLAAAKELEQEIEEEEFQARALEIELADYKEMDFEALEMITEDGEEEEGNSDEY